LSPRDPLLLVEDIRLAVEDIDHFAGELGSLAAYQKDRKTRLAVERSFIVIGEAMAGLRDHAPGLFARIEHGRIIISFRNIIVHGYFMLDDERVWEVIQVELPTLRATVHRLINELKPDQGDD
jgi:uncharacterized protein with HEPN domain